MIYYFAAAIIGTLLGTIYVEYRVKNKHSPSLQDRLDFALQSIFFLEEAVYKYRRLSFPHNSRSVGDATIENLYSRFITCRDCLFRIRYDMKRCDYFAHEMDKIIRGKYSQKDSLQSDFILADILAFMDKVIENGDIDNLKLLLLANLKGR